MAQPQSNSSNHELQRVLKEGHSPSALDTENDARSPLSGPANAPTGVKYQPNAARLWLIMSCTFLSLFLVALDRTIVTTAIPRITDEFHSLDDIGWYGSAYMLTGAASQPLFGRMYTVYNTKWVLLTSVAVFEVGSAICGAAPSSNVLMPGVPLQDLHPRPYSPDACSWSSAWCRFISAPCTRACSGRCLGLLL